MIKDATFSQDQQYRYTLSRIWDLDKPYLNVIGLNPSTADKTTDDPTIRRCIAFAKRWNCGGLIMTNLFAFRATNPRIMQQAKDPIGPQNNVVLQGVAANAGQVLFAWGNGGTFTGRSTQVVSLLLCTGVCLGHTKSRQPRHPLYVKGDTLPTPYFLGDTQHAPKS